MCAAQRGDRKSDTHVDVPDICLQSSTSTKVFILSSMYLFFLLIADDNESCADVPADLVGGLAVGQSHEEEARWRGGSRDILQNGERCLISAWTQNQVHSQPMCTMWPFDGLTVTKQWAPCCHFSYAEERFLLQQSATLHWDTLLQFHLINAALKSMHDSTDVTLLPALCTCPSQHLCVLPLPLSNSRWQHL